MEDELKRCPFCSEKIIVTAIKCKHCGEWFDERLSGESRSFGGHSGSHTGPSSGRHPGSPSGSNPRTPSGHQTGSPTSTPSGSHPATPSANTPLTGIHLVNHALGDRYEILEEIGRGGMATLYKAIQKSLERTVALKVVHQNLLHDTEFVARFHREAKLCASLNHPNIVTVHDEGEVSGVHFMAMEYLEGTDLHRLIRSRGRLTPEQTLQYLLPVAEALDYAHGKGYIHRDIKSANIFITGSGRVVLMDFGIAHAAAGTQLTRAGTVIGTPEYMSPEQAEGKKVDHRTDLYSLGVVMYECLAGKVPFKGDNAASIIYKLVHEQVDASGLKQSPAPVQTLIKALLSKQAANRPANARSVAEGMKLLQQGKKWQPPGVSSIEAASGSKHTGKQTQEPQTVKLGDKPGRAASQVGATSQGSGSPPKEKKKVPAVVWVLLLIGVVLGGVLINHVVTENRQQQEAQLEQSAWQQAERRKTIEAYNQYLSEYPRGRYAELAKIAIASIQKEAEEEAARERDRRVWNTARQTNSKASYEAYLRDFPRGQFANQARNALERITKEEVAARDRRAWDSAQTTNTIAAYETYIRNFPGGQYADQARSRKRDLEKPSSGTFTDNRDGQTYKWVRIGNQVWMAENLNYNAGSGSWCYDNNTRNCNTYGRLYNWETALNACPPGWRLPSDADWTHLTNYVGSNAGRKLKAKSGWQDNGNGTDDYGFSVLPGGYRWTNGSFGSLGARGYWWSSTETSSTRAWSRSLGSGSGLVRRYGNNKAIGLSVRCIREP